MKTRTTKRVLTLVLAIVLTFVLAVSAFATWSSFQGRNTNNGRIASGQPPITSSATATPVTLIYNDPTGFDVYTGVDVASVIQGNYAFTLYNGGVTSGTNGGARMQATDMAATNPNVPFWNMQLDADANNDNQLSTPYYDSNNNTIYAAVTYSTQLNGYSSLSAGWMATGGATIDANGKATFTGENQSVYTTIDLGDEDDDHNSVHTLYLPTDLDPTEGTCANYTITLTSGTTTYTLLNSTKEKPVGGYGGTYEFYNADPIPYGEYTLTISVTPSDNATATISNLSFTRYDWRLYSISKALSDDPNDPPTLSGILAYGEGQINTHINSIGNYLFFGGWGGTHSYYQYGPINNPNTVPDLKAFTPAVQDDFYYAGASKANENSTSNVVFGSESGKIYVRPVGDYFDTATGSTINLATYQSACGSIRSSICVVGSDWYVTSRGPLPSEIDPDDPDAPEAKGYLWKITSGSTVNLPLQLPGNSTSTPVVSSNNFVYVGYYIGYTDGGVIAVPTSFTSSTTPKTVFSGAPVQCSPIVYSIASGAQSSRIDYIYFATNAYNGAGYCYSMTKSNQTVSAVWTAGGTSSNPYAMQGFSSENGYLVYGDDGHYLYIVQ